MENDGNLRQVIDAEGRRESVSVAEDNAEGALLLHDFNADKVGQPLRIANVDVEGTDVADSESARPVAVLDIQQPDAEQLILIQPGPMKGQVTAGYQVQVGRLRPRIGECRSETGLRDLWKRWLSLTMALVTWLLIS